MGEMPRWPLREDAPSAVHMGKRKEKREKAWMDGEKLLVYLLLSS